MAKETFILDNSTDDARLSRWLTAILATAGTLDVATGHLEIGGLLALNGAWERLDQVRILMGGDISLRTQAAFDRAMGQLEQTLDASLENEKVTNAFLRGVDTIAAAIRTRKIHCRVYRQTKFHAKAFIAHPRPGDASAGIAVAAGSSNFTLPGVSQNVELNVHLDGEQATAVSAWFDAYWAQAEDVTERMLQVIERHVRLYSPFEIYARSLQQLFADAERDCTKVGHAHFFNIAGMS